MTHEEQQRYLIEELLKEDKRYRRFRIPDSDKEQKDLLRSLMNVRSPKMISKRFLDVQDEYLSEERDKRGIVDSDLLPAVPADERIVLWQGDITRLKVDAIVNAANSGMCGCFYPLHSCIDNIIHSKAGIELRLCCNKYMTEQAEKHDGEYEEPTGRAVITPGYNLPAKYVIHTVGPIVQPFLTKEHKELLASCYTSCLNAANENGLTSIAFCCISTGVFMFPQDKACEIAVKTVREWLDQNPDTSVKKVVFNVFKDKDLRLYDARLNRKIRIR